MLTLRFSKLFNCCSFSLEENSDNFSPVKVPESCRFFSYFSYFMYRFSFPQQPVKSLIIYLGESNSCQYFILKDQKGLPTTIYGVLATMRD